MKSLKIWTNLSGFFWGSFLQKFWKYSCSLPNVIKADFWEGDEDRFMCCEERPTKMSPKIPPNLSVHVLWLKYQNLISASFCARGAPMYHYCQNLPSGKRKGTMIWNKWERCRCGPLERTVQIRKWQTTCSPWRDFSKSSGLRQLSCWQSHCGPDAQQDQEH